MLGFWTALLFPTSAGVLNADNSVSNTLPHLPGVDREFQVTSSVRGYVQLEPCVEPQEYECNALQQIVPISIWKNDLRLTPDDL